MHTDCFSLSYDSSPAASQKHSTSLLIVILEFLDIAFDCITHHYYILFLLLQRTSSSSVHPLLNVKFFEMPMRCNVQGFVISSFISSGKAMRMDVTDEKLGRRISSSWGRSNGNRNYLSRNGMENATSESSTGWSHTTSTLVNNNNVLLLLMMMMGQQEDGGRASLNKHLLRMPTRRIRPAIICTQIRLFIFQFISLFY